MADTSETRWPGIAEAYKDPSGPRLGRTLADGLTIWLTGLPSAGKTTIANGLAAAPR